MKIFSTILTSAIFLAALPIEAEGRAKNLQDHSILTPRDVNADPQKYQGKNILIRGYVVVSPSGHILYQSERRHAEFTTFQTNNVVSFDPKNYIDDCITIANPNIFFKNKKLLNQRTITMLATVRYPYLIDGEIDLGSCPRNTAVYVDVQYIQRKYRIE